MTRKDFQAVANALNTARNHYASTDDERDIVNSIAQDLASEFALVNPRFDRDKFLDACGVSA